METKEYQIIGLTCQHCVRRVESALLSMAGVGRVFISQDNNRLHIDANPIPPTEEINALLESLGEYRVSETPVK